MQSHHLVLLSEVGQTLDAGPPFVDVISVVVDSLFIPYFSAEPLISVFYLIFLQ